MPLTATLQPDYALPAALIGGNGFDSSVKLGTEALCQSRRTAFFMPYRFMVGVLGSREARWFLIPVCQPDTSAALSLTALVGGLNPQIRSKTMTTPSQGVNTPNRKTCLTPFFSCNTDKDALFSVNADLSVDEALSHASCILASALAISYAMAENVDKNQTWGVVYLIEMSKAIVDAVYQFNRDSENELGNQ